MVTLSRLVLRREQARTHAQLYGGVLSRELLAQLGFDRHAIAREIDASRWKRLGRQTIAMHHEPLPLRALHWRAHWETRLSTLDGVSALQDAGLTGFEEAVVHVSVPHGWRPPQVEGVKRHHLQRIEDEVATNGIPRVRLPIAAVRGAHWAKTDRQAALVLVLAVQQRMVAPHQLRLASRLVHARRRRALVPLLVQDITDGAHSLGELDFGAFCRLYGVPAPDRQVVRHGQNGRIYLDVRWDGIRLVVEIDGSQHRMGLAVSDDNLRSNDVVISGDRVIRIDLIGFRLRPDMYMAQVLRAFAQL